MSRPAILLKEVLCLPFFDLKKIYPIYVLLVEIIIAVLILKVWILYFHSQSLTPVPFNEEVLEVRRRCD